MNNNFKKLLASAMALAMVTSVMPTVNVSAEETPVAEKSALEQAIEDKNAVLEVLNTLGDVTTIPSDEIVTEDKDFATYLAEKKTVLENALKYASVVGYNEDQIETLTYLVGTKIALNDSTNPVNDATTWANHLVNKVYGTAKYAERLENALSKKVDKNAVALYNELKALLAFKGNVADTTENIEELEKIESLFADLEAEVADYKDDNATKFAKKFVEGLVEQPVAGTTVGALVDDEVAISYTKRSNVEAFIKKVTKDSYTLNEVKYGDVKEEPIVEEYIDSLNTIVDEMKEAKDLLDDTKAEKKAFDRLSGKLNDLVNAINADDSDSDNYLNGIDSAIAAFRASDVKALKNYVENVVNEFWTVTVEKRTSGTYRVKEVDAGLGRYHTFTDVATNDLYKLMTTLVDRNDDETYYDLLVADAASIDELLKAVTTDIEGLTLSSTLTNKDAAKIIAAKKALTKIDDGIYEKLSRSERADVDANRDLIEAMYVKLILNGNVVKDGWVDLGNGNWDYYQDGKAFTGWVCSAKDVWYYVSNGHMLRDAWVWRDNASAYYVGNDGKMVYGPTTVNGYELDANGLWHK